MFLLHIRNHVSLRSIPHRLLKGSAWALVNFRSEFEDWRLPLASLLQPVPFPEEVLSNETFAACFGRVLRRMGTDPRCEIHLSVLGVREGKEGWFHLVCPGGPACSDDGELYSQLVIALSYCTIRIQCHDSF